MQLIVSDDHSGLRKARQAIFTGVPWQRCQFHLQQNANQYPSKHMQKAVAADIRAIFNAPDRQRAEEYLKQIVDKYAKSASRLSEWMEAAIPEGLTAFDFPEVNRRRIRTSNMLERVNQEIKRPGVVRIFPNPDSCLRLVSSILMEISEEWETGKIYLDVGSNWKGLMNLQKNCCRIHIFFKPSYPNHYLHESFPHLSVASLMRWVNLHASAHSEDKNHSRYHINQIDHTMSDYADIQILLLDGIDYGEQY